MQSEISDDFWSNFESRISSCKQRFDAIPSDVVMPKRAKDWFNSNLSSSKKRAEMEKLLNMESKIARLEKKASKRKRTRLVAEPRVQDLINRISDTTLREYLIIQLFHPDDEDELRKLLLLCTAFVNLPAATTEDYCTVFGKKLVIQLLMSRYLPAVPCSSAKGAV
jgi:CRISPR/Cas system-associated protein Cas5 (RAMP superfamily)